MARWRYQWPHCWRLRVRGAAAWGHGCCSPRKRQGTQPLSRQPGLRATLSQRAPKICTPRRRGVGTSHGHSLGARSALGHAPPSWRPAHAGESSWVPGHGGWHTRQHITLSRRRQMLTRNSHKSREQASTPQGLLCFNWTPSHVKSSSAASRLASRPHTPYVLTLRSWRSGQPHGRAPPSGAAGAARAMPHTASCSPSDA